MNPCVDVFIFMDDLFEGEEQFETDVQFLRLNGGQSVTSLSRVTVTPDDSTVTITDGNSKNNTCMMLVGITGNGKAKSL
jgi:hypothetical protein